MSSVKRKFSPKEDEVILDHVRKQGSHQWHEVSKKLVGRTPRQCRERWKHYLAPDAINMPWSEDEDKILIQKVNEFGFKWTIIKKFLPNHTAVNIKNRYSKIKRKNNKMALIPPSAEKFVQKEAENMIINQPLVNNMDTNVNQGNLPFHPRYVYYVAQIYFT